jgi:hypothetical protein
MTLPKPCFGFQPASLAIRWLSASACFDQKALVSRRFSLSAMIEGLTPARVGQGENGVFALWITRIRGIESFRHQNRNNP